MTVWSNKRLQRLFDRYNRLYWGGKLPHCKVRTGYTRFYDGELYVAGHIDFLKEIWIAVKVLRNDRQARSALLHEMAHAAVGEHGEAFDAEMVRISKLGAPLDKKTWQSTSRNERGKKGGRPRKKT